MSTRIVAPSSLFCLALALAACSVIVDPATTPPFCSSDDTNCGDGFVCAEVDGQRRCVEDGTDVRCSSDAECEASGSEHRFCVDEHCVECRESTDCLLGEIDERGRYCSNNECHEGCDGDGCCCPDESRCIERVCRPARDEECNDVDDDFDGLTDEEFDTDEDGVSSCPFVDTIPDCDDNNNAIYPGNAEICDGLDNDCDGEIDDGDLCDAGEACDLHEARCVESDDCGRDEDCPDGYFCHDDDQCYPRVVEFGGSCTEDSVCGEYDCISTAPLGVPGQHCTKVCCNEGDCPPATFCAVTESGFRLCAPPTWFDHGRIDVDCGGGACPACWQRSCHSQCCGLGSCDSGECQLAHETTTPTGEISTTLCDVRGTGSRSIGLYGISDCARIGALIGRYCASGYQWLTSWECVCSAPCCSHTDCTDGGADPDALCVGTETGFAMCLPGVGFEMPGPGGIGDYCSDWRECATGACHPGGYCTQTCCPTSTCPDGYDCRPVQGSGGDYTAMCELI